MSVKKASVKNAPVVEEVLDFSGEAMAGMENVGAEDLGIPFMMIIQSNSPERDRTSPKYIKDADQGMIINSVTRNILGGEGESVTFIPCSYKKMYVEWRPRTSGGGFVGSHGDPNIMSQTKRDTMGKDVLPNGNIIVPTAYIFGLVINEEQHAFERVVISFTSTQTKKARGWLSQMMSVKLDGPKGKFVPPMYAFKYNVSTVSEKNEKGSWYGWKIERGDMLNMSEKPLLEEARTMVQSSAKLLPAAVDVAPDAEDTNY